MASDYSIFWKCEILPLYVMLIISDDNLEQVTEIPEGRNVNYYGQVLASGNMSRFCKSFEIDMMMEQMLI